MANELDIVVPGAGRAVYAIVRRSSDAQVWDVANTTFTAWADGDIDDYDVALVDASGDLYSGDFPTDIPAGTKVTIAWYDRAGASPATTDTILASQTRTWNGSALSGGSSVSLEAGALTSLDSIKRHLRLDGTSTWDTLLTELINAASAKIKRMTNRDFVATNYVEWYDGNLQDELVLRQWPVLRVNRVLDRVTGGLRLKYTSGSDIIASAQVYTSGDGGLRLNTVNASGAETTNDLSFATYKSLSALETAIDALSGWTSTTVTNTLTKYLVPAGAVDCLSVDRTLDVVTAPEREYRVDYNRGALGFVSNDWHHGYSTRGIGVGGIDSTYPMKAAYQSILVDYRAGYETVPADINYVAREFVQALYYAGLQNNALQQESLGSYSYTLADQSVYLDGLRKRLETYTDVGVA